MREGVVQSVRTGVIPEGNIVAEVEVVLVKAPTLDLGAWRR